MSVNNDSEKERDFFIGIVISATSKLHNCLLLNSKKHPMLQGVNNL
jgi:hypothetical protein